MNFNPSPGTPEKVLEQAPKDVSITDQDAFNKIEQVEYVRFPDRIGEYTNQKFEALLSDYADYQSTKNEQAGTVENFDSDNNPIYGLGGFNRYFVDSNGIITFSVFHADGNTKAIAKARELGLIPLD